MQRGGKLKFCQKNTIRRLVDGDFLKQTRLNLGLPRAAIPSPEGEPNGNGFLNKMIA